MKRIPSMLRLAGSLLITALAISSAGAQTKLSAALEAWMASQSDPGAAVDTVEALKVSR